MCRKICPEQFLENLFSRNVSADSSGQILGASMNVLKFKIFVKATASILATGPMKEHLKVDGKRKTLRNDNHQFLMFPGYEKALISLTSLNAHN